VLSSPPTNHGAKEPRTSPVRTGTHLDRQHRWVVPSRHPSRDPGQQGIRTSSMTGRCRRVVGELDAREISRLCRPAYRTVPCAGHPPGPGPTCH